MQRRHWGVRLLQYHDQVGSVEIDASAVCGMLSVPRMTPYLDGVAGDERAALALYEWSARMSSAAFVVVGHLEVLLRNALDRCLRDYHREEYCGIPWFLMPSAGGIQVSEAVDVVRERLRPQGKETRDQVIAGLSFGFWSGLLGPKYEELWRNCLHRVFPHGSGRRSQISSALERVRTFRNRLAHHDSMIKVDIPFELRHVVQLAGYISKDASQWLMRSQDEAMAVYAQRPHVLVDTVVVPAKDAWPLYENCRAYVCQAGRAFRVFDRVAFYTDREIKPDVPGVLHRRDNVEWTHEEAERLARSDGRYDRKIAKVIAMTRSASWSSGRYQVFLLTQPGDSRHRRLPAAIVHKGHRHGLGIRAAPTVRIAACAGNREHDQRSDVAP